MKKTKIALSSFAVAMLLCVVSSFGVFAETYFYDKEYAFCKDADTGGVTISDYYGNSIDMNIPDTLVGYTVTSIAPNSLKNRTNIHSVSMTDNILWIGAMAFSGDSNLTEVTFSKNLNLMVLGAFQQTAVEHIDLSETKLTEISNQVFYSCLQLKDVALPVSVTYIGKYAFANCSALEKIVIPASVTAIEDSAFKNTANVTIYCYKDSYAQTFAESKGINYVLIDEPQFDLGDVNKDGYINISDVTTIQKYLADVTVLDSQSLTLADVNKDGSVSIDDATTIQKYIAEVIESL